MRSGVDEMIFVAIRNRIFRGGFQVPFDCLRNPILIRLDFSFSKTRAERAHLRSVLEGHVSIFFVQELYKVTKQFCVQGTYSITIRRAFHTLNQAKLLCVGQKMNMQWCFSITKKG